jgi:hypothetical protein
MQGPPPPTHEKANPARVSLPSSGLSLMCANRVAASTWKAYVANIQAEATPVITLRLPRRCMSRSTTRVSAPYHVIPSWTVSRGCSTSTSLWRKNCRMQQRSASSSRRFSIHSLSKLLVLSRSVLIWTASISPKRPITCPPKCLLCLNIPACLQGHSGSCSELDWQSQPWWLWYPCEGWQYLY